MQTITAGMPSSTGAASTAGHTKRSHTSGDLSHAEEDEVEPLRAYFSTEATLGPAHSPLDAPAPYIPSARASERVEAVHLEEGPPDRSVTAVCIAAPLFGLVPMA